VSRREERIEGVEEEGLNPKLGLSGEKSALK
jgi:hypothetical protein